MANKNRRRFSRDITRKLDNMLKKDRRAIEKIMYAEAERTKEFMVANMPVDTGELQRSVYLDQYDTDNGYGVGVGIPATQHNQDRFTNTKLANWLLRKPNKQPTYADKVYGRKTSNSQAQMKAIIYELDMLKFNVERAIKQYWKSKKK